MTAAKIPTAILISGRGSNMMSLVAASRAADYPAKIVAVISNRPDAPGLAWAAGEGLAIRAIDHRAYASRQAFEAELDQVLVGVGAELIAQAGFMRLLTAGFVDKWAGRIVNIHPSLLPAFKGLRAHEQALAAGVRISGCTVHYVIADMDAGPIVAQAAVPVVTGDTVETLSERILAAEHRLYPMALAMVAHKTQNGGCDRDSEPINQTSVLFSPAIG